MARGEFAARDLKKKRKHFWLAGKRYKKKKLRTWLKSDPLEGAPMARAIVLAKDQVEQKQPHSGMIKIVRVQIVKNGKQVAAHAPRDKAIDVISEHDEVTIAGIGGSQRGPIGSIPGVKYMVTKVNGVDLHQIRTGKKQKPRR